MKRAVRIEEVVSKDYVEIDPKLGDGIRGDLAVHADAVSFQTVRLIDDETERNAGIDRCMGEGEVALVTGGTTLVGNLGIYQRRVASSVTFLKHVVVPTRKNGYKICCIYFTISVY